MVGMPKSIALVRPNTYHRVFQDIVSLVFLGHYFLGPPFCALQEELGEQQTFQVVTFVVLLSVLIHGISAAPLCRIMFRLLSELKGEGHTDYSAIATGNEGDLPADGYRDDPDQQHMQP